MHRRWKFRQNIKRTIELTKLQFCEVKPTIDEFIAIFGMALWSGDTTYLSFETSTIVRRNRRAILKELQIVYSRNSSNGDGARLKEVFGLLSKSFQAIQS
ncbi:hypothetical protein PRIPAC_97368 [Pristionchus pacificus]|uniref:Nuclear receptor n=1 Tax=Pristionchus pacificus TaxID=54126 RepID=A0A2A6D1L3_PRIPA|nr:hypothetical protein PRIPAC_97368 [Pristionchus pacificus]|eukprot:PDM84187.1 nuclear receptor [Pristionchus pacificus]